LINEVIMDTSSQNYNLNVHIRQLTTSEMGGIQYRTSCERRAFPVEISLTKLSRTLYLSGSWINQSSNSSNSNMNPFPIILSPSNSSTILLIPIGACTIQFYDSIERYNALSNAVYSLEYIVQPTDMPNTQKAQSLFQLNPEKNKKSSPGVLILGNGMFRILFNEVSWAKKVRIIGNQLEYELVKNKDSGEWSIDVELTDSTEYSFRFEMELNEATPASSGPMTEFGWDSSMSSSHKLVSHEQVFIVKGDIAIGSCVSVESRQQFEEIERVEKEQKTSGVNKNKQTLDKTICDDSMQWKDEHVHDPVIDVESKRERRVENEFSRESVGGTSGASHVDEFLSKFESIGNEIPNVSVFPEVAVPKVSMHPVDGDEKPLIEIENSRKDSAEMELKLNEPEKSTRNLIQQEPIQDKTNDSGFYSSSKTLSMPSNQVSSQKPDESVNKVEKDEEIIEHKEVETRVFFAPHESNDSRMHSNSVESPKWMTNLVVALSMLILTGAIIYIKRRLQ